MTTLTSHVLYTELAESDSDGAARVKLLLWNNCMARQRFQAGQMRPHWKVYKRADASESRALLVRQVDSFVKAGFRMTIDPILVELTEGAEREFIDDNVSYPLRNEVKRVVESHRKSFEEGRH